MILMHPTSRCFCAWLLLAATHLSGQEPLPGTDALDSMDPSDRSATMVRGIGVFLDRQIRKAAEERPVRWHRDFSSRQAYESSLQPQRERLARMIGAVEPRVTPVTFRTGLSRTEPGGVREVSWPVVDGVFGEGILLTPDCPGNEIRAGIVVIPGVEESSSAFVKAHQDFLERLVGAGCQVLIPTLVNRDSTWSGSTRSGVWTNLPHREWIYRQGFDLGRQLIGYEVQEVMAAVDWFAGRLASSATIGCIGYDDGGRVALYAASLDSRILATLVSGYFGPRESLWREPIDRNVFGLLRDFGDAELATMISPRSLLIEHARVPTIQQPVAVPGRKSCAAPGAWSTRVDAQVAQEVERARVLLTGAPNDWARPILITGPDGEPVDFPSAEAVNQFLDGLRITEIEQNPWKLEAGQPWEDPAAIQARVVRQFESHLQTLLQHVGSNREMTFWKPLAAEPEKVRAELSRKFKEEVIGWFDDPRSPLHPRSRLLERSDRWTKYEVTLEVFPDVFAWGYLLVPRDLAEGEKRPLVVCQHGLEGLPGDVVDRDETSTSWRYYKAFGADLADRGYVVFAPHNPYRGGDAFRELQRKANPLGCSLFSIIGRQHEAILDFLTSQPFVDQGRIGFYGLSYGGKSAMRLPVLEPRYALSICSGDFNEWVWKNTTTDWRGSYVFAPEYEIFEWDLGHAANYAEMAALIAPRPFMVERGHRDGVGLDEWVAFEYAKVRRYYVDLGLAERTEIGWFDGPHTIHGTETFAFLAKWLGR